MKTKTYKIVVFLDLRDSNTTALKSTLSLAKIINAEIEFFHVKNSTELVNMESQLSAKRSINEAYKVTENTLKELTKQFSINTNISINYAFAFGNVKREVKKYLKEKNPDIVVLGKKKRSLIKPLGDNFTGFVLKQHKGPILVADFKNSFEPTNELSLGIFNYEQVPTAKDILPELMAHIKQPLKSFKIGSKTNDFNVANTSSPNTIDFIFDAPENISETLSKYVAINNVNLLCIERPNKGEKSNNTKVDLKSIIAHINVPLLISGTRELQLS
jgi:nucleotide-binding universal stress UspA family protein